MIQMWHVLILRQNAFRPHRAYSVPYFPPVHSSPVLRVRRVLSRRYLAVLRGGIFQISREERPQRILRVHSNADPGGGGTVQEFVARGELEHHPRCDRKGFVGRQNDLDCRNKWASLIYRLSLANSRKQPSATTSTGRISRT